MYSSKNEEFGLTTDATPNPRKSLEETTKHFEDSEPKNEEKEDFEKVGHEPLKNNGFNNTFPNYTAINVIGSKHVHIGNKTTIMMPGENKPKNINKHILTDSIKALMVDKRLVRRQHLNFIHIHIGENWKDVARKLNFSDGQIEQLYMDHMDNKTGLGIKEVIYKLLLDWIQNEPDTATIGKLITSLWDSDERDAVKIFEKKFASTVSSSFDTSSGN